MKLMYSMAFISLVVLVGIIFAEGRSSEINAEGSMDITLVVAGDIAEQGGIVEFVIRPDPELLPINESIELTLTAVASIVIVDTAVGEVLNYRFSRLDGKSSTRTLRFGVGSYRQGDGLPDAAIYSHFVDVGGDWTLSQSRRLSGAITVSSAQDLYPCQTQLTGVVICDASSVIDEGLPE